MGLRFEFAASRDSGAHDHFFHFLMGYVLPSLSRALAVADRDVSFECCGPLLNVTLADACSLMGLNQVPRDLSDGFTPVVAQRWDNWLFRLDGSAPPPALVDAFQRATASVRTAILNRAADAAPPGPDAGEYILVLQRSPSHAYYRMGGHASILGYGSERRQLRNVGAVAEAIDWAGFPVRQVDMGSVTFSEQVALFRDAKAVIGARGAEFAHLLWMRPNSHAFMFATPIQKPNHASRTLAFIRSINLTEFPVADEHFDGSIAAVQDWLSKLREAEA